MASVEDLRPAAGSSVRGVTDKRLAGRQADMLSKGIAAPPSSKVNCEAALHLLLAAVFILRCVVRYA
jgi:hypothetical protein